MKNKKKTKAALAIVQEVMACEDEFAWEYARFIRSECFCKEEEACSLSQLERDTVKMALARVQRICSISGSSVRRLFQLAVEKKLVRDTVLPHLEEDPWLMPAPLNEAHRLLGELKLDLLKSEDEEGLYWLVWEYIPIERILPSEASSELKTWQMMARFIEDQAQGLRDGF